jgi:hypothetical protein
MVRRIRMTMLEDEEFRQKFAGIGEIWNSPHAAAATRLAA